MALSLPTFPSVSADLGDLDIYNGRLRDETIAVFGHNREDVGLLLIKVKSFRVPDIS